MFGGKRYGWVAALAVLLWSVGLWAGAQTASTGSRQAYPTKPIRLISPFAPGGPNDILARLVAQRLAEPLGQTVIVDNRPGAGGNLGTDLVAKSTPDGYTLVMAGAGSLTVNPHVHIAYKGTGPATAELLGGQVQVTFSGIPAVLPHVRAGKLRALGTSMLQRVPALPDVPSVAETLPGYEINPWYGVLAPARTPHAVVRRLHEEIVRVASTPEFSASLTAQGATPVTNTPEAFSALLKDEMQKWGRLIRSAGISAN